MTTTPHPPTPQSLIDHFADLPDPRLNRTKDHDLIDVLVIAICALLCAGESFNDMEDFGRAKQDWFKTFLGLRNGIPSHDTFNRVFAALDPKGFLDCFLRWTQSVRQAVPREIVEADADYVLALKGNQERVHEEVKSFLDAALEENNRPRPKGAVAPKEARSLQELVTVEKDHGRIETRRYYQSDALAWFADKAKWEGLGSVGMVEARREINGKTTLERRYYLSSLKLDVETFARAVRGHWGVENKLHWVLDVCFREDQCRARQGYAAENLATLRRLALNLLKREKTKKRGIKAKMLNASWHHPYLLRLLGVQPKEI